MLLLELFDDGSLDIGKQLRQAALDLLTPLAAQKLPFVTVQQVVDELRQQRPGILVDRALIMDILKPDEVRIIKKIEGDRIYLDMPAGDDRDTRAEDEAREKEKIASVAQKQAKKAIEQ